MSRFFFKENRIDRISGFPMIYIGKKNSLGGNKIRRARKIEFK